MRIVIKIVPDFPPIVRFWFPRYFGAMVEKKRKVAQKVATLPCGRPAPGWRESKYSSKEKRLEVMTGKLERFLAEQELNFSESRNVVLATVAQFESHFTASLLIGGITKTHPKIGAATVYRSIQSFIRAGILRETLATDSGEKVYESESSHHHDHLVCLDCDAILEFHEPGIELLQEKVLRKLGFREARHRHVIYAHCEYKKK